MARPPAIEQSGEILTRRALNRALLARQLLLQRVKQPAAQVVEHLVGMQAQVPNDPYIGLWSRIDGFQPNELGQLVAGKQAVRGPLLRATLHLVTTEDWVALRATLQPMIERRFWTGTPFGRRVRDMELAQLVGAAHALVEDQPRTTAQLRGALAERWPNRDPASLAAAATYLASLVQVAPRGVWGRTMQPTWTTTEAWIGQSVGPELSIDELVLRYLAAFGPANARDIGVWSGLTRLREVLDRLRPRLRAFRDEAGRELLDLPDAPRPDPETPVPPRFLPQYDNFFLAHADRSRVDGDAGNWWSFTDGLWRSPLLIDGSIAAAWRIVREGGRVTLLIEPPAPLAPETTDSVAHEGARLLDLLAPEDTARQVRFAAPAR
jgi:hypothetical protein